MKVRTLTDFFFLPMQNRIYKANQDAIFVFGMQKAGTSAIARLLAAKTGKSVTIDTKYLWSPYNFKLKSGELTVHDLVARYGYPFSKDIIKEPEATFLIQEISSFFRLDIFAFIIRNPYQNIRSILNRLGLPGNLKSVDYGQIHYNWKHVFPNKGADYVKDLAVRWNDANGQLGIIESGSCLLVKYEDFIQNKEGVIRDLALKLNLEPVRDISGIKDKQFTYKGQHETDPLKFFGEENYQVITDICAPLMERYGY